MAISWKWNIQRECRTDGWIDGWIGGWADVRRGIESRVDSQTVSAGSGLMDNVPLDHKLLPPRHE